MQSHTHPHVSDFSLLTTYSKQNGLNQLMSGIHTEYMSARLLQYDTIIELISSYIIKNAFISDV